MSKKEQREIEIVLLVPVSMQVKKLDTWIDTVNRLVPWAGRIHVTGWKRPEGFLERDQVCWAEPGEYLPEAFRHSRSSCTLMLNLHRIPGLSENFIFFPGPYLPAKRWKKEDFFWMGRPVDFFSLQPVAFLEGTDDKTCLMCMEVINGSYRLRAGLKEKGRKWFSLKNGVGNVLRSLTVANQYWFPGFRERLGPLPFCRETFVQVWEKEEDFLAPLCCSRSRQEWEADVRVFRYWQLASGDFQPCSLRKIRKLYRERKKAVHSE